MAETINRNQAAFTFEQVRAAIGAIGDEQGSVRGVTTDSRRVEAGSLFVALRGEKFDGHAYLQEVAAQGATAVVVDHESEVDLPQFVVPDTLRALGDLAHWYRGHTEEEFRLVAVTGSYGKTSTRAFIAAALRTKVEVLASEGNFNNEIGLPLTLLQLGLEHDVAVVEMGMRGPGQIKYLAEIAAPNVGVITNIGPQHIELLGSEANIADAKAELLEALPRENYSLAVLPADSPWLEHLKAKSPPNIVTFGLANGATYHVDWTKTDEKGNVLCDISFPANANQAHWGERRSIAVHLPVPGAHNAVNAAAAFAVAHCMGVSPEQIVQGLESAELPGARMRVVQLSNGTTVIDDCYNAGPTSMQAALQTLLDFPGSGRRVAILGAMRELGEHSEAEHAKIGRFAGIVCDVLVGVDGETRPLLNAAIAAAKEVENEMQVSWCDSAAEAAARIGEWTQSGDVVLVKGSRSIGLEAVVEALSREL